MLCSDWLKRGLPGLPGLRFAARLPGDVIAARVGEVNEALPLPLPLALPLHLPPMSRLSSEWLSFASVLSLVTASIESFCIDILVADIFAAHCRSPVTLPPRSLLASTTGDGGTGGGIGGGEWD